MPDTTTNGGIALVEQFAFNSTVYETDGYFPGYVAETKDKGAIRNQNVIRVLYYPVQFNPIKREAIIYSKAKLNLTFYNPNGSLNSDVGIFNEIVGNNLINYNSNGLNASESCGAGKSNRGSVNWFPQLPNQMIDSACDYLIITHQDFYNDPVAKKSIDSLAYHRATFNGFDVAITTRSAILNAFPDPFQPVNEKFFGLIFNTYSSTNANHTYDGKLGYVNLFGDVELQNGSPGVPTYSEGYDVYFTQLTYDSIAGEYDVYPDLMIGRCPVSNTAQVKNIVHKILHYKPDTLAWKNNMLNVVGTEAADIVISYAMLELDEIIEDQYNVKLSVPDNFAEPVPDWNTIPYILDTIQSAYQQGVAFFNYFGHGAVSYWQSALSYYTQIPATPNYNLPFVISVACHTGAFQSLNECLGEKFLCADSAMGAIGFIGATEGASWGTA